MSAEARKTASGLAAPSRLDAPAAPGFTLEYLAGRLVELSGPARLTLALGLVHQAQRRNEPAAWIAATGSLFFPPDAASAGIDLEALPVLRLPDANAAARAADHLLRSGAFGLAVLDLGDSPRLNPALAARLQGLARRHDAAVLFLTRKDAGSRSLSPLVSLRAIAWRRGRGDGSHACGLEILKDKRHGNGWTHEERRLAPTGVC